MASHPTGSAAPDEQPWRRVAITVPEADAERASDVLWLAGVAGIEEHHADGGVHLVAGVPGDAAAAAAVAALASAGLGPAEVGAIDDDGLDAWRAWARPERAGRWWIAPPWAAPPTVRDGEQVIWIDPGRTFGSGSHPTTRLVLCAVQDLAAPGRRVLDVGTGSGVLAVGAALAGTTVDAVDLDPASPAVVAANAERNGVADRVHASTRPLAEVAAAAGGGTFDLVLANLLAPVIVDLAADLVRCTAPGGTLVASGLLADRWEATVAALAPLVVREVREEDGWVAVVLDAPDR